MSKAKKIWIISASIAVAVGLLIVLSIGIITDFSSFKGGNEMKFSTKTYAVDEEFKNIKINDTEYDIYLAVSDDNKCKVVCNDGEKLYHTVEVEGDTLTIKRVNKRKWYENIHFGFSWRDWESLKVTVYLPKKEYQELTIETTSGDVVISDNFGFAEGEILNTSGDIICRADFKNNLNVNTTSGDISCSNVAVDNLSAESTSGEVKVEYAEVKGRLYSSSTSGDLSISNVKADDIAVKCTSGDIEVNDVKVRAISAKSTSGDIKLKNTISSESFNAKTVSGDIEFDGCDGKSLKFETTSGDVEGSLLTEKLFVTKTTSGDVDVPAYSSDERCEVSTVSGDIDITVLK